ncbi:MAG: TIGR02221 family CRISPR-associated protein [Spirochaetales bacterium]
MTHHLLSFLGTGNYEPCKYQFKGKSSSVVTYIQLAFLELLEELHSDKAKVSIFLTKKAREKHWESLPNYSYSHYGLAQYIQKQYPTLCIEAVDIPEGGSPEELWQIFSTIFECIQESETLYADITHSFRSLPMFGLVLLNYARMLKNIRVGGIYYGAFEALGSPAQINAVPPEQRIAPVFDLTSVYSLMEWNTAVNLFLQAGRAEELAQIVRTQLKPILSDPGKRNLEAIGEQKLADMLKIVSMDLLTNRGQDLRKGETFFRLQKTFSDLQGKTLTLKPLEPLLKEVEKKFSRFQMNSIKNGYRGVEWCIQHGWIQQGITQLQETIITHMLELLKEKSNDREKRQMVSTLFDAKGNPLGNGKYQHCLEKDPSFTRRVFEHSFCKVAFKPYNQLRDPRNDINHGGYVEQTSAQRFEQNLKEAFEELKNRYREEYGEDLY